MNRPNRMPHHALEITLTRPLTPAELHRAARTWPLAANHDATRLMTLTQAPTPHRAAHRLRRRLDALLPIDVITTHYPDTHNTVLLNVALPRRLHTDLTAHAQLQDTTPNRYLELAVKRALAEHADREADRLDHAVRNLLVGTTPAHLLSAVAHVLTRPEEPPA